MSVIKREEITEKILFERKKIYITDREDTLTGVVFLISLIAAAIGGAVAYATMNLALLDLSLFLTAPLVVLGVFHIVRSPEWWYLIIIAAAVGAMFYFKISFVWIMALILISIGIVGVVELVVLLQKFLFYRVVSSVEYLNIKSGLSLFDRVVAFVFNISKDLDTRNLEVDEKVHRASLPWKDIGASLKVSFIIGVFIWIYLSMNPKWMAIDLSADVPVYLFAVMMYIPVIVLPFSIFMSLNVRIETKFKEFKIYDGIKGTLLRMAVPVFAAFMYVLLAVNDNGLTNVLVFILLSVLFNFVICVAACMIYYKGFESKIVDRILSKWNEFRPVQMLMGVDDADAEIKEDVPDTPKRDYSDFGELVLPSE